MLWFPAPHSFTGEDVLELHTHGSPATVRAMLACLCQMPGVRMAEAGEFTRRAFQHGKLDLVEAEGLADLIHAQTERQRQQALHHWRGHASRRLEDWRSQLLETMALLEAWIDFPEEDIPDAVLTEAAATLGGLRHGLEAELQAPPVGERIAHGLRLVIVGPANAGKSSLLNWLAKRDAAIVSHIAGTTRDVVQVDMEVDGYAVTLVDTAGLRDATDDPIEQEGMRRTRDQLLRADGWLVMRAVDQPWPELPAPAPDQPPPATLWSISQIDRAPDGTTQATAPHGEVPYQISLKTGEGMEAWMQALRQMVAEMVPSSAPPLITCQRHRDALTEAALSLKRAEQHLDLFELCCDDLRMAAEALGRLTGRIHVDELLGVIFGRFCIGK
jgi:tRNA modification GTPase